MRFYYDRDRERGRDCVAQNVGRRTSLEVVRAILSSDRRLASVLSQDCREAGRRRVSRCLGTPHEAVNGKLLEEADRGGMLLLGAGMALIYSGLDQGNPLDWLESGTVVALLGGGGVLTASFFVNEALVRTPWTHAKILLSRNVGVSQVSVAGPLTSFMRMSGLPRSEVCRMKSSRPSSLVRGRPISRRRRRLPMISLRRSSTAACCPS
jgi:hypothetical protein